MKPTRRNLVPSLLVAVLLAAACSKPKPNAPVRDFATRHSCPVGSVDFYEQGKDRMVVNGCGHSEVFVRECGNSTSYRPPGVPPRQPVSEEEARLHSRSSYEESSMNQSGCAWSRDPGQDMTLKRPLGD